MAHSVELDNRQRLFTDYEFLSKLLKDVRKFIKEELDDDVNFLHFEEVYDGERSNWTAVVTYA